MSTSAQRRRNREQREVVRRQILEATEEFLRAHPYRDLSVEAVMAQTGLTRTAFYRHFDDVTDLMLRVLAEVGQDLLDIAARWDERADAERRTAAHEEIGAIVEFFSRHGPLVEAISEAAVSDEQVEAAYTASLQMFVARAQQAFDRRVRDGLLDVPDTRSLALALTLMNQAYLLHEFGRDRRGDPERARGTLETVWLRTIAPPEED